MGQRQTGPFRSARTRAGPGPDMRTCGHANIWPCAVAIIVAMAMPASATAIATASSPAAAAAATAALALLLLPFFAWLHYRLRRTLDFVIIIISVIIWIC